MMKAKEYYKSTRLVETRNWTLEMVMAFADEFHEAQNQALRIHDVVGRSEQLKCKHEPDSLKGKYTNCKHCTTILQLKP